LTILAIVIWIAVEAAIHRATKRRTRDG
jgi:hypothetical protein